MHDRVARLEVDVAHLCADGARVENDVREIRQVGDEHVAPCTRGKPGTALRQLECCASVPEPRLNDHELGDQLEIIALPRELRFQILARAIGGEQRPLRGVHAEIADFEYLRVFNGCHRDPFRKIQAFS